MHETDLRPVGLSGSMSPSTGVNSDDPAKHRPSIMAAMANLSFRGAKWFWLLSRYVLHLHGVTHTALNLVTTTRAVDQ